MGDDIIEFYVHTSEPRERDHFKAIAYVAPSKNFVDIDTTYDTPEQSFKQKAQVQRKSILCLLEDGSLYIKVIFG